MSILYDVQCLNCAGLTQLDRDFRQVMTPSIALNADVIRTKDEYRGTFNQWTLEE